MLVQGAHHRSIQGGADGRSVVIIDQTRLPHAFVKVRLQSLEDAVRAIRTMQVRGAPLIGATAAWGFALGLREVADDAALIRISGALLDARPTAVNLRWAVERMLARLQPLVPGERANAARGEAQAICDEDVATNEAIGTHGLELLRRLWQEKRGREPVRILTHCNAGWLATVDWGTALAPVYLAHREGLAVHILVDETRPRNQGAALTCWELAAAGISHHLLADNAGGYYMQRGLVDCCIVGSDRTTAHGDVCNKIGTYLKALAAHDNNIPFYVALPGSTIDWDLRDGLTSIPIEERDGDEVLHVQGMNRSGQLDRVAIAPVGTKALNPAFDVTPACLVSALITERGVCPASREGLLSLYPERKRHGRSA